MNISGNVTFHVWGARGSIFAGGADQTVFGGDTTCFSIETQRGMCVIDAGSGLRLLGRSLMQREEGPPDQIDLLLTHLHFDHICGLPFFEPLLRGQTVVRLWCALFEDCSVLRSTLARALSPPIFPVDPTLWDALEVRTPGCGNAVSLSTGGEATAFRLTHPDGGCGWRIEVNGRIIAIASDHEMGNPAIDSVIAEASHGADLLICDASYTEEEFEKRRGWGHSTWRQGLRLAGEARAKSVIMSHHLPERTDLELAAMEAQAQQEFANTMFARAGWSVSI